MYIPIGQLRSFQWLTSSFRTYSSPRTTGDVRNIVKGSGINHIQLKQFSRSHLPMAAWAKMRTTGVNQFEGTPGLDFVDFSSTSTLRLNMSGPVSLANFPSLLKDFSRFSHIPVALLQSHARPSKTQVSMKSLVGLNC